MLLNEHETRLLGLLLAAIGLGTIAASLARLAGWPVESSAYIFATACGSPVVLGVSIVLFVWARGELARARAQEWDAQTRLAQAAPVAPVASVETVATPPPDTSEAWRVAVETFLLAGDVRGFSARKLAGVVGSDGWPVLKNLLMEQGILAQRDGLGTVWADGMTLARALTRVRAGLPYPDGDPPTVEWALHDAATRNAASRAATAVVSGTARPVD